MIFILIVSWVPYFLSLFLCEFSSPSAVGLVMFSLTPMILPWRVLTKATNQCNVYRKNLPKNLNWIINLGILSALINIYLCASAGGFDFTLTNTFQSLSEAASYNAVNRYISGAEPSSPILMMLAFNALIISSLYGKLSKTLVLALCFGLYTILTLAKWPLYIAVSIIAAGYIATSPFCGFFIQGLHSRNKNEKTKAVFIIILIILLIATFLTYAIFLRTDMKLLDPAQIAKNITSYTFNQFCNYSYWYEKIYNPSESPILNSFFPGPASLLGGVRLQGIYEQSITLNDTESNIFTVNRGLIETFTLFGPLVVSCFAAAIIIFLRKKKMLNLLVIFLNTTLIACFLGINTSIFKDNSVWISVIISSLILIRFPPLASSPK